MPDFDVRVDSGTSARGWDDPRLNHRGRIVHIYRRVAAPTAPALATVVLHAVLADGTDAPLDAALGGRLFSASRLGWSGSFPFALAQTVAQSSVITLRFAANMLGHQELSVRRAGGGAILLAFEVES